MRQTQKKNGRAGLATMAVYGFGSYEVDDASYEKSGDGFLIIRKSYPNGAERTEEIMLNICEPLPCYEDEEEMLVYFLEKYPDMTARMR